MAYAITHLAAYPKWQDWIREEIDQLLPPNADLGYEPTYPNLKRCLALMVRPSSDYIRMGTTND